MDRKAKILCTIGPASCSKETILRLIQGGMDVARLNFSHGEREFHLNAAGLIRKCSRELGRPVALMQDLQGIKIRTGPGEVRLVRGRKILISPGEGTGTEERIFISYKHLARDASPGDRVLLDDGLMELKVVERKGDGLLARVVEGGVLKDRKGVNLPGMEIRTESFTPKDRRDLELAVQLDVDYVAVSFVRSAADIEKVRDALKGAGRSVPLIAKIEKPEAIANIGEILESADGLMVARGDLGVEVSPEEVPMLQKMLIERANRRGRLVITATQMLESMTLHTTPTRAEAADVANAVIDGSDALMLSAETSSGRYPVRALRMMDRIIRSTEREKRPLTSYEPGGSYSEAVAEAAATAALQTGARCIAAFTQSGYTARLTSKFRPHVPVIAFTPHPDVVRRMSLYWGVTPRMMRPLRSTDSVFREVEKTLLLEGLARPGDSVVITAGTPIGGGGRTNLMKLHRVGDGGGKAPGE
jgi:pyruvate kinase